MIQRRIIEGKWTTLVMRELLPGKRRYSEILKALIGIGPKVLTTRLRMLNERKLVTRSVYPTIPPTTEYELTNTDRKLEKVLGEMAVFGNELKKANKHMISDSKSTIPSPCYTLLPVM